MGSHRGRPAADDRRRLVDQLVIRERLDHEQRKVHAARQVAREDGIAHVRAPDGEALALAFVEGTARAPTPQGGDDFALRDRPGLNLGRIFA